MQVVGSSVRGVTSVPVQDLATTSREVRVHADYRYAGNESYREDAGQIDIDTARRAGFYNLTLLVMSRYVSSNCPRAFRR